MGNLDFTNHFGFSWYCVLLLFSGVVMLMLLAMPRQLKQARIVYAIFGVGFLGYSLYLIFMFHGGTYIIFFKAFILPILLIANAYKSMMSKRDMKTSVQDYAAQQQFYQSQQQANQAHYAAVRQAQDQVQAQVQAQIQAQAHAQAHVLMHDPAQLSPQPQHHTPAPFTAP